TCEATRVRGEQSAEAFDLRMACLGRHRIELEATIETLSARVSVTTLRGASGLVASLPSVQQCADVEHLRDRGGPTDPEQAAQVQQLGERLARARALVRAGRTDEAASIADELERRTTELDAVVLHGETMMLRGRLAQVARDDPDTEQWFERAYADGVEARHAPLAIDASVRLVDWLGSHEARTTEAELWAQQARAWLRDRGEDDPRHTQLLMAEGSVYQVAGRLDDAQQAYSRAVARLERQADSEGLADAHRTLGTAQMGLGDARAASEHFTEELALRRRLLGEQHPSVGRAHRSLGATLYVAGELPKALAHFERALAIIEASLGPEHPMLAGILGNLGSVRDDLGDSDEARELLERALAIMEAAEGTGVTEHVGMLGNLASALRHGGQPLAAAEHLRRAATLIEQAHGPTHPEHVALLTELGTVLLEAGRGAAAREVLEQAEGLRSSLPADASLVSADAAAALGRLLREQGEPAGAVPLLADAIVHYEGLGTPLDPRRGRTLLELGRARMTLGEARAARMALEDAIVLLAHRQQDSAVLAAARFELAQALIADGGDTTERAKSLAGDALAGLDEDDPLRGRIRSWLDAHP
ncbi:MAG: tetratricopeptide repeat protein, partial [Nannocystaceae bacterium]